MTRGGVFDDASAVVILVGGQSNADAYGTLGIGFPGGWVSDPGIQIWVPGSSSFATYAPGTNSQHAGLNEWGEEAEYARRFRLANPTTPIYIVKVSQAGVGLAPDPGGTDWAPTSPGELYDLLLGYARSARYLLAQQGKRAVFTTFLWIGMETDALTHAAALAAQTNLENFEIAWRSDLKEPKLKFVISRINTAGGTADHNLVRAAQATVGGQWRNGWTDTDALPTNPDPGHYSDAGQVTNGLAMWNADVAIGP